MQAVELLYFPDCPNLPAARDQLRRAFEITGRRGAWAEIDICADGAPAHTLGYGSPTILVDGNDVSPALPNEGQCCRIYANSTSRGVPPLEAIIAALQS